MGISFPRAASKSSRVLVKGPKDCVAAAEKRIEEIVSDLVNIFCDGESLLWAALVRFVDCVVERVFLI